MKPRKAKADPALLQLASAISRVGFWNGWQNDLPAQVTLTFRGVQLYTPPPWMSGVPPYSLTLRVNRPSLRYLSRRGPGAPPADWVEQLQANRLPLPLYLDPLHFGFDRPALANALEEAMSPALSHGPPPLERPHTLTLLADPVGAIVGADGFQFELGGTVRSLSELANTHRDWLRYRREYYLRKGGPVEAPFDYVCELSGPPAR